MGNTNKYKNLFELSLQYSDSLFVLLNKHLHIQTISPKVEDILGWDKKLVCGHPIDKVFKNTLTEPFFDVANLTKGSKFTTHVYYDDNTLEIVWDIIPIFASSDEDSYVFVIGNIKYLASNNEMLAISKYPLLDVDRVLKSINYDKTLLHDILTSMSVNEIPRDLELMKKLEISKDWESIEKIVHKMKGGAMYCGTTRMQYACLYFEQQSNSGRCEELGQLYKQLIQVCKETRLAIKTWLAESS